MNNIKTPWLEPGYKGKLRKTPNVTPVNEMVPIDDLIGLAIEWNIDGALSNEKANRLLNTFDELKKQGNYGI